MLNDPFPAPPLLYYNNIERDNGTAPWQKEEALIRSLSLGMKRLAGSSRWLFLLGTGFRKSLVGGISLILKGFYPPSKLTSSKLTFRAWSGCCQWDWRIIKGCSGLGIAQGVSSVLKTGWEYGELSKDLKQALKPLSLPCISEVNCTPGSVAGISPLQSPTEAQKMVMPVKHCLG